MALRLLAGYALRGRAPSHGAAGLRTQEVVFQRCNRIHDDGSQEDLPGTEHPAPVVIKRTA